MRGVVIALMLLVAVSASGCVVAPGGFHGYRHGWFHR